MADGPHHYADVSGTNPRLPLFLLIPQPLLSLAYIASVRGDLLAPSFVPVLLFALFPVVGMVAAGKPRSRGTGTVFVIAVLELVWTVLALAIVGFAIGLRSG